ncbi:MAG TPA: sialidase family protein, partial [Vicinamibacterales bacterium]|nr:sialidase family protein [Vicinamibacterales bacterium]
RDTGSAASPTLAVAGRASAFVSLAADGDRVAATWIASSDAGADIFAAVSEDGGRRFGAPERVNDIPGDAAGNGEQPPRLALQDRAMTVIWVSKRDGVAGIRAAQSNDAGRTFAPARTISPEGLHGARGWESVALDADGVAHAAWLDGRNAQSAPAGAHVHGAMRQDIVHAMWRGDGEIVETPVASDVCFCCKTGVVARGRDVFVVWRHLFPGGVRDIAIARSGDGGRTFAAPVRVSEDNWKIDACPDDGPSIVVEDGGVLHVVWPTLLQDGGPQRTAIFEAVSRDGGATFSPRARVDSAANGASHPRIASLGQSPAVVWDEFSAAGRRVMWRAGQTPARALGEGSYPAVAAARGSFVVAWTEPAAAGSRIRTERLRSEALPLHE